MDKTKVVFFGDSITDMSRNRETDTVCGLGCGYVMLATSRLSLDEPNRYAFYNRGIGGNRTVDLYARIKADVWNLRPDVLSIFIGINDLWHDIDWNNGVEPSRFENVYRTILSETKTRLPNVRLMMLEPYVMHGTNTDEKFDRFVKIAEYAAIVRKLAGEFGATFVPLQERMDRAAKENGAAYLTLDGVHPEAAGAQLIADAWLEAFRD